MRKALRKTLNVAAATLFVVSSAVIAVHAFNYLSTQFNPRNPFHVSFAASGWAVPAHFFAAGLALLIAPLQLSSQLRRRWPALHRRVGWVYVATVMIGGLAGLRLAFSAQGGWSTGSSFLTLAVLWLLTTAVAIVLAIRGDSAGHRRWMLRSVALTFSGVTLRVILGLGLAAANLPFPTAYLLAAWLSWPLNLLFVEVYLWRQSALQSIRSAPAGRIETGSASRPQTA